MTDIYIEAEKLEEEKHNRRAARIAQMRREKLLQEKRRKLFKILFPVFLLCLIVFGVFSFIRHQKESSNIENNEMVEVSDDTAIITNYDAAPQITEPITPIEEETPIVDNTVYSATETSKTRKYFPEEVISTYGIVIDLESHEILAAQNAKDIINPASMTKILTVLVAAEHITKEDLDDTFTITQEITSYAYVNDCSAVNFANDETVTVRDLFYGTVLPSGADAAVGLATYVAGSHEAFVELMNEKLEQLGLSDTAHFTNCVGLYDPEHHCTMYDMAMIMEAAMNNEICKEVLNARKYTTSSTPEHPEGITISNWFLRRIEDKDTHGEVLGAKTGFVVQSGNCAASYGVDDKGHGYIIVTGDSNSSWRCIYDHVALYQTYLTDYSPEEDTTAS